MSVLVLYLLCRTEACSLPCPVCGRLLGPPNRTPFSASSASSSICSGRRWAHRQRQAYPRTCTTSGQAVHGCISRCRTLFLSCRASQLTCDRASFFICLYSRIDFHISGLFRLRFFISFAVAFLMVLSLRSTPTWKQELQTITSLTLGG